MVYVKDPCLYLLKAFALRTFNQFQELQLFLSIAVDLNLQGNNNKKNNKNSAKSCQENLNYQFYSNLESI